MEDFEFENATILYSGWNGDLIARFKDGSVENYGSPNTAPESKIILTVVCMIMPAITGHKIVTVK